MAINKKLIHFNHKEDFLREKDTNNNILDTSIVFIKDTQELWTHGQYYKGLTDKHLEILNSILSDYKAVDLGLPSGTLWADRNIGAVDEYDGGKLFQWGDPTPYDVPKYTQDDCVIDTKEKKFDFDDYKLVDPNSSGVVFRKYNEDDNKTTLDLEDDAANILIGNGWTVPTQEQIKELLQGTTQELYAILEEGTSPVKVADGVYNLDSNEGIWNYINDSIQEAVTVVSYIKLSSKTNGNVLIIPSNFTASQENVNPLGIVCCFWSSQVLEGDWSISMGFQANSGYYSNIDIGYRCTGTAIRGVTITDKVGINVVTSVNGKTGMVSGLAEYTDLPYYVSELYNDAEYLTPSSSVITNKVDKVSGKSLVSNTLITKLNKLQGSVVALTQSQYNALSTKDSETLYIVD